MKISKCKCEGCKAEFETLKSDKELKCPSCESKNVKEVSTEEIQTGCGGGCSGCKDGCG